MIVFFQAAAAAAERAAREAAEAGRFLFWIVSAQYTIFRQF